MQGSRFLTLTVVWGAYRLKRDKINETVGRKAPHYPGLS